MAGIELTRDIIIIIFGLVGSVVLIFLAFMSFKVYAQVRLILDSLKTTSENLWSISYMGNDFIKPIVQFVAMVRGIRQGINAVSKFFKKEEEEEKRK